MTPARPAIATLCAAVAARMVFASEYLIRRRSGRLDTLFGRAACWLKLALLRYAA